MFVLPLVPPLLVTLVEVKDGVDDQVILSAAPSVELNVFLGAIIIFLSPFSNICISGQPVIEPGPHLISESSSLNVLVSPSITQKPILPSPASTAPEIYARDADIRPPALTVKL